MAKGMSLEEFRSALSSDATVENERLKRELNDLRIKSEKQIKELSEERDQYKKWCQALGNRCFVHTGSMFCLMCEVECCKHAFSQEDLDAASNYMIKNNLPRTPETYEKVSKFLNDRRFDRSSK